MTKQSLQSKRFTKCFDANINCWTSKTKQSLISSKMNWTNNQKNLDHFSICACHPCAGAMLIFSVSFQFYRMSPKGQAIGWTQMYIKSSKSLNLTDVGLKQQST